MARIEFANVNLEYPVREHQGMTLKECILRGLLFRPKKGVRTIHALKDLSFTFDEGERIGIIGLNGAGKSTLLKTIAGIYPIRSGQRDVEGSLCSLFDINLGFEPDATGWKNIYYRSYLQGETPTSVRQIIKEIGDFTELGHFLDLPIRCYSTGMIMRLAFAIATSRHPEILLIDEVFATGDLVFQRKALQRLNDFILKARLVVMVSHQLDFLQNFCTKVLWLREGKLHAMGPAAQIIEAFKQEAHDLPQAA